MSKSVLIDDKEVLIRLAHSKITAAQYIRNVSGLSLTDSVAYLNKLIAAQPIVEPAKKESMWIDAISEKPKTAHESHATTVEVLFWVEGRTAPTWGHFDFYYGQWFDRELDVYITSEVKYFAYIDNPYK